jgi:hypothetical protein
MTAVRRDRSPHRSASGARSGKAGAPEKGDRRSPGRTSAGTTRIAQVRLRPEEMAALQVVMRTMHLDSTSDALREGLRLLAREATEIDAAADIRAFYADRPVPLPDGVSPATDDELSAADEARW